jgi:hypothetical protein
MQRSHRARRCSYSRETETRARWPPSLHAGRSTKRAKMGGMVIRAALVGTAAEGARGGCYMGTDRAVVRQGQDEEIASSLWRWLDNIV